MMSKGRKLSTLAKRLPDFMSGRADSTIRKTRASVLGLLERVGNVDLATLNRGHLMTHRAGLLERLAPATVNKELRQIKSALTYAVDAQWMPTNPAWRWRGMMTTEPQREIRVVEPGEFGQLTAAADPEMSAYLGLCYWQGLRRAEACQIRWPQIRFQPNVVVVLNLAGAGELTKSRKNRTIPMRRSARSMLWRLRQSKLALGHNIDGHVFTRPAGQPWNPDTTGGRFARLVQRVGLAKCSLHDLRRSFSTLAQRRGVDVGTVMLLGGWSSVDVVRRHYTGDLHGHLAATMATLDQSEGADYATDNDSETAEI